jgi:hypothetical protein
LNDAKIRGTIPEHVTLAPIFVFGKGGTPFVVKNPYEVLNVDVSENYTNLYKKLFAAYKEINARYTYDFIWKVDDDTKINFESLNTEMLEGMDYVGRMLNGNLDAKIRIDLDFCNLHKEISFKPPFFDSVDFQFASGDSYFLSRRAVDWILQQNHIIEKCEGYRVNEDRLFGYLLRDKDLNTKDISLNTEFTEENDLQATEGYLTIHPISMFIFTSLIGFSVESQIQKLNDNKSINLLRRKAYVQELENELKRVINNFVNSKRSIGLG